MKPRNHIEINDIHDVFEQSEQIESAPLIELTENEMNNVLGGRWVDVLEWCVRDITCTTQVWVY